jgi:hypothetical protein
MSGKKTFKPLGEDLDELADRVAAAKNIPTLTPPARAAEEGRGLTDPPRRAPEPPRIRTAVPKRSSDPATAQPKSPPASSFTDIRLRFPNHIRDQLEAEQLRLRQEGQRVTINYLFLSALRRAGYRVEQSDLIEDGRRLR